LFFLFPLTGVLNDYGGKKEEANKEGIQKKTFLFLFRV